MVTSSRLLGKCFCFVYQLAYIELTRLNYVSRKKIISCHLNVKTSYTNRNSLLNWLNLCITLFFESSFEKWLFMFKHATLFQLLQVDIVASLYILYNKWLACFQFHMFKSLSITKRNGWGFQTQLCNTYLAYCINLSVFR